MDYQDPQISVASDGASVEAYGSWAYTETWAIGFAYVLIAVAITQIDATP